MNRLMESIHKNTQFPVIVCRMAEGAPLEYANSSARILLNPLLTVEQLKSNTVDSTLADLLSFENQEVYENMLDSLCAMGAYKAANVKIRTAAGDELIADLASSLAELGDKKYFVIYLFSKENGYNSVDTSGTMSLIFHAAYNDLDVDAAINRVLAIAGAAVNVSRAYIFEPTNPGFCANTYEWCAAGTQPVIDQLQNLNNADYNYDVIVNGGMYITDDIRDLPEEDFIILEAQGIKAISIIPLVTVDGPIGYIGFDDCENYRAWSSEEVQLLSSISNVLISLIERRKAAAATARSYEILQTISDNTDNIIYISDIDTYELKFVNNSLLQSLGGEASDFVGKPCWQKLQKNMSGPCGFCPLKKMLGPDGKVLESRYQWEFQNTHTGNWYMAKDSIITWIDGTLVHMESAIDITRQKTQEEQLLYYASVDTMTGAFNREWGYRTINDLLSRLKTSETDQRVSLCFLDIDGLKKTNDTYGHQAGDDLILSTVKAIQSTMRKTDLICRWGGDEFIVLMQCPKNIAEMMISRAQKRLDELNVLGDRPYKLGFSYGIIELGSECNLNIDAVILASDKLMYENKMSKAK